MDSIRCAIEIQQRLAEADDQGRPSVRVRIGMAAGEPVTDRNDLFGATVQLAARLCARAEPASILVASVVRDLALGKGFVFRSRGRLRSKGFDATVPAYEVIWQSGGPSPAPAEQAPGR